MKLTITFTALFYFYFITASAQAGPIQKPGVIGSGCPFGSVIISGVNTNVLNINFKAYDTWTNSNGQSQMSCKIAIPITIPSGYKMVKFASYWQGFLKGNGSFQRKYFIAGEAPLTQWLKNSYSKPKGGDFVRNDYIFKSLNCNAKQLILRLNSSIDPLGTNTDVGVDVLQLKVILTPC